MSVQPPRSADVMQSWGRDQTPLGVLLSLLKDFRYSVRFYMLADSHGTDVPMPRAIHSSRLAMGKKYIEVTNRCKIPFHCLACHIEAC